MKINDIKHNHSLTDLLKVILFALIMLAPIGSIASRCLYVICNKNAYQSYYGETINQKEYININYDKLKYEDTYYLLDDYDTSSFSTSTNIIWLQVKNFTNLIDNTNYGNGQLRIYVNNNLDVIGQLVGGTTTSLINKNFSFQYIGIDNSFSDSTYINNHLFEVKYNNYSYLDNVFEYSVANIENNQLFNWTQNTALYSGINAMCTNLQIGGSAIPIILTYWTLITIIYVIIDIVLKMFTTLTHLLSKKT